MSEVNSALGVTPSEATSRAYRYYTLAILTTVYIFNFIDRQILVILQEDIKAALLLSDSAATRVDR